MANNETSKKTSPWVWVGVGCAGLIFISLAVFTVGGYFLYGKAKEVAQEMEDDPIGAMAGIIAAANPDVELIEADADEGFVSFRNTSTGEEFRFSYEDIEQGRVSFTSDGETTSFEVQEDGPDGGQVTISNDEGTTTFSASSDMGDVPSWLPVYPGAEAKGAYASETPEARAGAFSFETTDSMDDVVAFYKNAFEAASLTINSETKMGEAAMVLASSADQSRSAQLTASAKGDTVEGLVNFTEK